VFNGLLQLLVFAFDLEGPCRRFGSALYCLPGKVFSIGDKLLRLCHSRQLWCRKPGPCPSRYADHDSPQGEKGQELAHGNQPEEPRCPATKPLFLGHSPRRDDRFRAQRQ
jgi:hypothetical protein